MYSFHKAESGRLRTGSRCTPGSSCTGRDSGGCGALQKVCSIRLEPPLRLRGGGSCRSPSRCMRSMATRQLISLRPPVRFAPLEQSTCQSGQLGARAARIVGNQGAQLPDLLASEAAGRSSASCRLPARGSTPGRSLGGVHFPGQESPQLRRCPVARFGAGLQIATQPALRVDLPQLQGLQDREQHRGQTGTPPTARNRSSSCAPPPGLARRVRRRLLSMATSG